MSWQLDQSYRRHRARSALSLVVAAVALVVIGGGGSLLSAQTATFRPTPIALVGRTSTVCTVGPAEAGSSTDISAVVIRQAPGRAGTLTGTPVGQTEPTLTLTEQGQGRVLAGRTTSELLTGEGVMATASSGEVFSRGTSGAQQGLMAAPCGPPSTEHWLVGVGASSTARSELILTNPDDAQAEVDLQFFGEDGEVVVPGSPGVVVDAHASRTVSLESLVSKEGPLTVSVRASNGRVSAVARDQRSADLDPAGADWHTSAVAPTTQLVIPDVPEGDGTRELLVVNPGTSPAEVTVQVLAESGPFAPVGAETIEVRPSSTASVDLAPGLVGQSGGIRLSSNRPITASVVSASLRADGAPDFAVQSATPGLVRTGVVALATGPASDSKPGDSGAIDSELVLSNGADKETTVAIEVLSYAGVSLRTDDVLIGGRSTSTRRLNLDGPAYLVVRVTDGADVHGGVVYSQPDGVVAGLATVSLTSPDVASRAPVVVNDPAVGR